MIRFGRHEPRLILAIALTALAGAVVFSVALLEAMGVVRVFAVVHNHANGVTTADHMYGLEYPSRTLTTAHKLGVLLTSVGIVVWVLRVARRTAGYFIGGRRAIGLLIPPFTVGVLAGALHAVVEGVVNRDRRALWHRLITAWCSITIGAVILDAALQPGWSSIGSFSTLGRGVSMGVGATVVVSVSLGVGIAARLTWMWQHLSPNAAKALDQRLAQLPFR